MHATNFLHLALAQPNIEGTVAFPRLPLLTRVLGLLCISANVRELPAVELDPPLARLREKRNSLFVVKLLTSLRVTTSTKLPMLAKLEPRRI